MKLSLNEVLEDLYQNNNFSGLEKMDNILESDIFIVSDYIEHKPESTFSVFSFLITDGSQIRLFEERMVRFRIENNIPTNSFFDFKKVFQDRQKKRLLPHYLEITEEIRGFLLVLLIEKKYLKNFAQTSFSEDFERKGFGKWKPHIFAEMFATFSILAFLLSKIKRTNVSWLSDEDSRIGNNDMQVKQSLAFLDSFLKIQGLRIPKQIFLQCDSRDIVFQQDRDLKSIVDLPAGSVNDFIDDPEKVRDISRDYFKWFDSKSGNLFRKSFQIYHSQHSLRVSETRFKDPI